jgi:Trypsin-like peptidase domain
MEGWTPQLVSAARDQRPANPMVAAAAERVGLAVAAPPRSRLERMISDAAGMLDPVEWRSRLGVIETQVCRVEIPVHGGSIRGTGFLVGSDEVMTNHHVVQALIDGGADPAKARLRFDYKRLADGVTVNSGVEVALDPDDWLVGFAPPSDVDELADPGDRLPAPGELDFALLRLATAVGDLPVGTNPPPDLPPRGWIDLDGAEDAADGAPVFIMQHPEGEPVKLAIDTVIGLNANRTRLRYRANTEGGSSGSPVFDINLRPVALHHSGDPNFDPDHKPEYNEGVPMRAITAFLAGGASVPPPSG